MVVVRRQRELSSQELGPWSGEVELETLLGRVTKISQLGREERACVGNMSFKMYKYCKKMQLADNQSQAGETYNQS